MAFRIYYRFVFPEKAKSISSVVFVVAFHSMPGFTSRIMPSWTPHPHPHVSRNSRTSRKHTLQLQINHSVANIRRHLAGAVPPQDQILLLGPPYKVLKDSLLRSEAVLTSLRLGDEEDAAQVSAGKKPEATPVAAATEPRFGSAERTGSRRIFLFSKRALTENSPEAPPCRLEPMDLTLPTEPDPSPVAFPWAQPGAAGGSSALSASPSASTASPLHHALEVYERRFMLNLCCGRALADGADVRLASMRGCVSEMIVMARALRAAVSNLSDHRNGASRTRAEFVSAFQTATAEHAAILQRFESKLASLATVSLHPALASTARASGRVMETLLDTVPVERERAWMQRCQTSHQRLAGLFAELEGEFGQLGAAAEWEETAREDSSAEEDIERLFSEVESGAIDICNKQAQRLNQLTSEHGEVVRVVMRVVSEDDEAEGEGGAEAEGGTSGGGSQDAQAAFSTLEKLSKGSADVLPSMEKDDTKLRELMLRVADGKTGVMRRMQQRLREVSAAQSAIQRVISSVGVLRDALSQQSEDMAHLDHISELPGAYRDFISEIKRRRAYGEAVTSTSEAMMQRLASMRADEVKAREGFLRGSGRHLMPAFFEIFVPTLATPPPLFTPQLPSLVELDTLPDVGASSSGDSQKRPGGGGSSSDIDLPADRQISADNQGVSSASTLTDSVPQQQEEKSSETAAAAAAAERGDDFDGQEPLIVCADENSNDIILDTAGHDTAADAVRKTLAYENYVLRQAIEKMGGKTPKSYIEEAQQEQLQQKGNAPIDTSQAAHNDEFTAVKAELEEIRSKLEKEKAKNKLNAEKADATKSGAHVCDKISHSSFQVGDVGLFMPTGRGSGGKRTYLAFHTNCPHRYLSTDGIEGNPDYVLGRIVYQEELVAGDIGTDSNPYGLHPGTNFFVLTVEVLKVPGKSRPT